MTHLTSDELVDAVDGALSSTSRDHLEGCAACQHEITQLSLVLREARSIEVPQPSPLYWAHFSERVRTAVQAEGLPSGGWPRWMGWRIVAPMGSLALVVLALVVAVPRRSPELPQPADLVSGSDVWLADEGWALVADMVGDLDWDTARAAGFLVRPGVADEAALELSADEGRELTRLLRVELDLEP